MRVSQQLTTTLREAPRDVEGANQELLVRAGFIRQLTSGVYSFLPLGNRVIRKIAQIVREEMDRAGAMEVLMPALQPVDIWQQSGRFESAAGVLFKVRDPDETLRQVSESALREIVGQSTLEEVLVGATRPKVGWIVSNSVGEIAAR